MREDTEVKVTRSVGHTPSLGQRSGLAALFVILAAAAVACLAAAPASAVVLPDGRAYEVVTPTDKNAANLGDGLPSFDGSAVNWASIGACCGAPNSAVNFYQSQRHPLGWLTSALSPTPLEPLVGLFQEQVAQDYTSDLSQSIFITGASYAPGDNDDGAPDLYRVSASGGTPTWLSQGPIGGTAEEESQLGLATRDFNHVAFTSHEALTPDAAAQPLAYNRGQYLYLRDVAAGTTTLVNVDDAGNLVNNVGAILGNAGFTANLNIPANYTGTSRNAVSSDGSKVFFETPPENSLACCLHHPHLYMRDLSNNTTTPLDDPGQVDVPAQYEGASDDGSLVFFTTTQQGLTPDADPTPGDNELYGFNTDTMTRFRVSAGDGTATGDVIGETAISNDGSHVFFVARGALAPGAVAGDPNFYVYDTTSGVTTFIAKLAKGDIVGPSGETGPLVDQPDVNRPAIPTATGSVLVFASSANLTDENPAGPSTTLAADAFSGETSIEVASTAGLVAGRRIAIGPSFNPDNVRIRSVVDATHLNLVGNLVFSHSPGDSVDQLAASEIYRYTTSSGSIVCLSCPPPGVDATRDASFGLASGGAYGPIGLPMTADGSKIFFNSPDPLVPEDLNSDTPPVGIFGFLGTGDVYEWENGDVSLISDGRAPGSSLGSTTPSGNDVTFTTSGQLVPQDQDGFTDIYDARVNGGIPVPVIPPQCQADGCKPPPSTPPPGSTPGSSGFAGPGNQPKDTTSSTQKKKKCKSKKSKGKKKKCKKKKNRRA